MRLLERLGERPGLRLGIRSRVVGSQCVSGAPSDPESSPRRAEVRHVA